MEWILLFTMNFTIFLFLVDWKELKINIWSGFLTVSMAIIVDFCNITHGRYAFNRPIITVLKSSLFFLLGPVFVIGVLFAQYHPKKRWLAIVNVFVIFILYSLTELALVYRGAINYLEWKYFDSLVINIGAMVMLSWFSIAVLNKWGMDK